MSSSEEQRYYEIVVWDATGHVGRLVCRHLAQHSTVRWALGGRRLDPLEKLKDLLCAPECENACPPKGIVASGGPLDRDSCDRVAQSCSLLINASSASIDLPAACAANGTHYVDDCASHLARKSIALNETIARKSGAKLVHCCGSLPTDVLVALALKALWRRHGQDAASCVVAVEAAIDSGRRGPSLTLENLRAVIDSTSLCGEQESRSSRSLSSDAWLSFPDYNDSLETWFAPRLFSTADKVVRRSRRLLRDVSAPRRNFKFRQVVRTSGPLSAILFAVADFFGIISLKTDSNCARLQVVATGTLGEEVRGEAVVNMSKKDASVATMISETALCILASEDTGGSPSSADFVATPTTTHSSASGGGIFTPAVFAEQLRSRLSNHGFAFEIFPNSARRRAERRRNVVPALFSTILFSILVLVRLPELVCSPPALFIPVAVIASYGLWRWSAPSTCLVVGVCVVLASNLVLATSWREPPLGTLSSQRWLVTETGNELGLALSQRLADHGAKVLTMCVGNCGGDSERLDLVDFASIESFAKNHRERFDGIVLNDEYVESRRDLLRDKTRTSTSNFHVGQALLVRALNKQRTARVLVVSSNFAATVGPPETYADRMDDFSSAKSTVSSTSCSIFYCPQARANAALISYALAHLELPSKRRDQQQLEFVAATPGLVSADTIFMPPFAFAAAPFRLFARSPYRSALALLRASMDDTVAGKVIDSQGIARGFEAEVCPGCEKGEALLLAQKFAQAYALETSSLAHNKTRLNSSVHPTLEEKDREGNVVSLVYSWQITVFFLTLAALSFFRVARSSLGSIFNIDEAAPSGPILHFVNAIVHHRVAGPLFEGVSWAWMLAVGAVFAPLALVIGALRCLRQLLSKRRFWNDPARTAVVVTGCDSGIGKDVALELSRMGYKVFALCLGDPRSIVRAARDYVESRDQLPVGVRCDVTRDDDVWAAAGLVEEWLTGDENRVLGAVVNNAGVSTSGFLEWLDVSDLRRDMDVNYFGVHRVTRAFLPLLRRCRNSRMCIVASMAGKLPIYSGGGYSASKHAVVGYAGSLHLELKPLGIRVCCITPSFHRTPMVNSGIDGIENAWRRSDSRVKAAYGGEAFFRRVQKRVTNIIRAVEWDHRHIVDAVCDSVVEPTPRPDTPVGLDARLVFEPSRRLPRSIELAEYSLIVVPPPPTKAKFEEEEEVFSPPPQMWADTLRSSSDQERNSSVTSSETATDLKDYK